MQITSPPYNLACHYCGATHALNVNFILNRILAEALIGPSRYFMEACSYHRGCFLPSTVQGAPSASVKPHQCLVGAEGVCRIRAGIDITNHQLKVCKMCRTYSCSSEKAAYKPPSPTTYRTSMDCTVYHIHANASLTFLMNAKPSNPIYVRI